MTNLQEYQVVVVGAGNAALSAALSAREEGASVLLLEKAPIHLRGGNTYFTGGAIRFAFQGMEQLIKLIPDLSQTEMDSMVVPDYPTAQYYDDLMRVTEGLSDPQLAQTLVNDSYPAMLWLRQKGVRFVPLWGRQAFKLGDKYHFWGNLNLEAVGAGKGLSDQLFAIAEKQGVEIRYQTKAVRLLQDDRARIRGIVVQGPEGFQNIAAQSVVLACGGFEANAEMRTRYLGAGWELAKVRGTQYNTGDGIRMALEIGAQPYGNWSSCHAVAWDLNAPPYGNRQIADLYQKHSYQYGLIVNIEGKRFVDEGADYRNYTYARYGREILKQPQRAAFQIFDAKVTHLWRDEYRIPQVTKAEATTFRELAEKLGIAPEAFERTIQEYNAAVQPGEFNPTVLDGKSTKGIDLPKSNWALPMDTPPYYGFAVTCGITFTFGGLRIDQRAQVWDTEEIPIPGLYAAGELVGGLFYNNYPGGSGLCSGAVFGRIAGASAARYAVQGQR
ncbi:MAG: FAD-dependent tricarballylate dehydrogenase TcuA [Dehalococcoidia bacterium]|nr:FAD-dependent tricarballylate dehydrogenase TcuA [Dehalococcoidia bacterium]